MDGFRCLVCTHDGFRARSRRGWNMTSLLPELERTLPPDVQLHGELVAHAAEGQPDFHRLGRRMLHGDSAIPITYMVFDVLAVDGTATTTRPYSQRRALLEELNVEGPHSRLVVSVDDGQALYRAVCERGLEGVVAKRERDPYRPGERVWVKTKNRATARYAEELEAVRRRLALGAVVPR
jgi:bifunctional non-homologous end joining protein LigD